MALMAGIRFGLYTSHGSGKLIPHPARIIQIDPDAREIGRLQPVEFGLVADTGPVLEALAAMVQTLAAPDRTAWQTTLRAHVMKRHTTVSGHVTERSGVLHPLRASAIVAEHVTNDITVVADSALTYLWLSEVIAEPRPAAALFPSHLSSVGYGFGIAVGAQAGVEPGKRVILVTGDGAVRYSLAEFDTAVRNNLPLIVVVMNNQSWGATLHFQQIVVGASRVSGTRLENGRYEKVAAAFGAGSYYADSAESLRVALHTALSRNEPACINVLVDLDPIPPKNSSSWEWTRSRRPPNRNSGPDRMTAMHGRPGGEWPHIVARLETFVSMSYSPFVSLSPGKGFITFPGVGEI
jgi:acetolactate synthase-1/2/3 large subunit